jgi:Lysyl oxidase
MRRPLLAALSGALALSAATALAFQEPPAGSAPPRKAQLDENPCIDAPRTLLCPDLVMRAPFDITVDRRTRPGHLRLRAGNSIDSLGRGPMELHGRRTGGRRTTMTARQAIYRSNASRLFVDTGAMLGFKRVPGRRFGGLRVRTQSFWKYRDAARFELWRVNSDDERIRRVRTGPKVYYCLRDLQRTHPGRARSPSRFVYPSCNTSRRTRRVTLGTSVGWSDVYPASYPEQWIDVTGLRGRFAYVHIADPENGIYESNEDNNESEAIVRLPSGRVLSRREGVGGRVQAPGGSGGGVDPGY